MTVGMVSWVSICVKLIKPYPSVVETFYLLHPVWQTLGCRDPPSSLQMTQFCSFSDWGIFYCVRVPHTLYPFIGWWTFSFLLCPGYCRHCRSEHRGACVFVNRGSLRVYVQEWSRELIRSCCILSTKGAQLGALWPSGWMGWGGLGTRSERERIDVYILLILEKEKAAHSCIFA